MKNDRTRSKLRHLRSLQRHSAMEEFQADPGGHQITDGAQTEQQRVRANLGRLGGPGRPCPGRPGMKHFGKLGGCPAFELDMSICLAKNKKSLVMVIRILMTMDRIMMITHAAHFSPACCDNDLTRSTTSPAESHPHHNQTSADNYADTFRI